MIERFSPNLKKQMYRDPEGEYVKHEIVAPLIWALNGIIDESIDGAAIAIAEEALKAAGITQEKNENIHV